MRWWVTHSGTLSSLDKTKNSIQHHFIPPSQLTLLNLEQLVLELYDGISEPRENVAHCIQVWEVAKLPSQLWVHQFIHSLGQIQLLGIYMRKIDAKMFVGKSFNESSVKTSYSQVSPLKSL